MLTIRDTQMAAFEADAKKRAMERLAKHLRAACRAQTTSWSAAQLDQEVARGVEHARRYGIEGEADLRVFLECSVELGADFDVREDTAWAGGILRDEMLFPEEKATLLSDRHFMFAPKGDATGGDAL